MQKREALRTAVFATAAAAAMCGAFPALAESESCSADAEAIAVDSRTGGLTAVGPVSIGYDPGWCGITNEGAYVVLRKVLHGGMFNAVTSEVATFTVEGSGAYTFTAADGEPCVRLVHQVFSADGEEIGDPLVRDVAFGFSSDASAGFFADSRTNSLQEIAGEGGAAKLAYDTAWATNAAAVTLSAVRLSGKGGEEVATNAIFSASADSEGATLLSGLACGWWRLLCRITDGSGGTLLEYATDEFRRHGGFMLIVR